MVAQGSPQKQLKDFLHIRIGTFVVRHAIGYLVTDILSFDFNETGTLGKGNEMILKNPCISFCKIQSQRNRHFNGRRVGITIHGTRTIDDSQGIFLLGQIRQGVPSGIQGHPFLLIKWTLVRFVTDGVNHLIGIERRRMHGGFPFRNRLTIGFIPFFIMTQKGFSIFIQSPAGLFRIVEAVVFGAKRIFYNRYGFPKRR